MVFQLPVMGFPEVVAPHRLGDYEHFRPYLATHDLRFSYGAPKLRARSRWQRELENMPVPELVKRLEHHGFAALYLNRRGFADNGEATLLELDALGYKERIASPDGHQVAVMLRPSTRPVPPLAESFTYGQGWHLQPEAGWRWAYEDAALSYFNPYPDPILVDLRFDVVGATTRPLLLERDGETVRQFQAADSATTRAMMLVELAPGVNCFTLRSPAPAVRQGVGRNQLRSFALRDVSVRPNIENTAAKDLKAGQVGGTPGASPAGASTTPLQKSNAGDPPAGGLLTAVKS
jgi:phosphoglycerol transferase